MSESLNTHSVYVFLTDCFGFKMTTKFNNFRSALAIFFSAIILFAEEHHEFKCMYEALVILINKF